MKEHKLFLILLLIAITFSSCKNENKVATLNEKVPNYTFTDILNSTEKELSIQNLRGKPIILEFWTTWCGPCIPAMKKLDSLQKKFKDKLEIITVSYDNRDRLKNYIETTKTSLRIAYDTTHFKSFEYRYIPHTIIIDKDGYVRAITSPEHINENVIKTLINENEISLAIKSDYKDDTTNVEQLKVINDKEKIIRLTNYNPSNGAGYMPKRNIDGEINGFDFWNSTIVQIYSALYDNIPNNKTVYRNGLTKNDFEYKEENLYNLTIEVSEELEEGIYQTSIDFMNSYFDVSARKVVDTLQCYVLKNVDNILQESKTITPENTFRGPMFKSYGYGINKLIAYLDNFVGLPVVDLTGLTKKYDIELNWQFSNPKTLNSELKKYGLVLEKSETKMPVEVLEIYKKE